MKPIIAAGLMMLVCVVVGCAAPPTEFEVPGLSPSEQSTLLTPELAAELDGNGFFRLVEEEPNAVLVQLSKAEVRNAVQEWLKLYAPLARLHIERLAGSVDVHALRRCGGLTFAESAFEPLPAEIKRDIAQQFGPFWYATLCQEGTPKAVLAISADEDESLDGWLSFISGIPDGRAEWFTPTAESVARRVTGATGARIAGTPRLFTGGLRRLDAYPRWEVLLDREVNLTEESGNQVTTDRVFFGRYSSKLNDASLAVPGDRSPIAGSMRGVDFDLRPKAVGAANVNGVRGGNQRNP